jgi:hypothetical protein
MRFKHACLLSTRYYRSSMTSSRSERVSVYPYGNAFANAAADSSPGFQALTVEYATNVPNTSSSLHHYKAQHNDRQLHRISSELSSLPDCCREETYVANFDPTTAVDCPRPLYSPLKPPNVRLVSLRRALEGFGVDLDLLKCH